MNVYLRVAWASGALLLIACQPRGGSPAASADAGTPQRAVKPAPPATAPAAPAQAAADREAGAGRTFASDKIGITFALPAGWVRRDSKDYELMLVPEKGAGGTELTLDVPDLPAHVPGMIPIGMVRNGYVDDLKKAHGVVQVKDEPAAVDGAKVRRVRVSWKKDGKEYQDTAVLLVHGDRVYILRTASEVADEEIARAALDQTVKSVGWGKKK